MKALASLNIFFGVIDLWPQHADFNVVIAAWNFAAACYLALSILEARR